MDDEATGKEQQMGNVIRPFEKPSYTMFHNFAVDVAMPTLSGAGWKVLCVAIRQTWGWVDNESPTGRKLSDQISYSQFMEKTGLVRSTVARAIKECLEAGYLVRRKVGKDARSGNPLYAYALNTEYEVSSAKIEPLTSSAKIEPLSGTKIELPSGSKIEPTKETKKTKKDNVDGVVFVEKEEREDERVLLLLDLAQDERKPLDLKIARAIVEPYNVEQVSNLVTYARKASSLRDPLAFGISRLRSGELPVMPTPDADHDRYAEEAYQENDVGRIREPELVDPKLAETNQLWQAALSEMQLQMTQETFTTWLKPTRVLAHEDSTITIVVENPYAKEWLDHRLRPIIERTLSSVAGKKLEVEFVVPAKRVMEGENTKDA